jgi:hypothetical protein
VIKQFIKEAIETTVSSYAILFIHITPHFCIQYL